MDIATGRRTPRILPESKQDVAPAVRPVSENANGFVFVRCENQYYNIAFWSICYVEASGNYCRVVTTECVYMVLARLKDFSEALPSPAFCQIHRAMLVNIMHVARFDRKHVFIGDAKLSIGDHYFSALLATAPVFNPTGRGRKVD